jgi:hypothetical protein
MSPTTTGTVDSSTLVRSWSIIGLRELDPGDGHASLGQRHRDPTGPDRQLERAAAASQLDQAVDRRPDDLRGEHADARCVVALGRVHVPDVLGVHRRDAVS